MQSYSIWQSIAGETYMKRTLYTKFSLIAVAALTVCIALTPCKPAAGFGGASAASSGNSIVAQSPITQAAKAEDAIPAGLHIFYASHSLMWDVTTPLKRANNPKWDEAFNKALQELAWKTVIQYPYSGVKAPLSSK
jgi:hypothetical protein